MPIKGLNKSNTGKNEDNNNPNVNTKKNCISIFLFKIAWQSGQIILLQRVIIMIFRSFCFELQNGHFILYVT